MRKVWEGEGALTPFGGDNEGGVEFEFGERTAEGSKVLEGGRE